MAYFIDASYFLDYVLKLDRFMSDEEFNMVEEFISCGRVTHSEYLWLSELQEKLIRLSELYYNNSKQFNKWN